MKTNTVFAMFGGIIVVVAMVVWLTGTGPFATTSTSTTTGGQTVPTGTGSLASCGDTLLTATTITVRNQLNTSGSETYDQTGYLFKVVNGVESPAGTITDTTAGATNLACGATYRFRLVSTNADAGASASIVGIDSGLGATVSPDGKYVEFTPTGPDYTLSLQSKQHGIVIFKMFDNKGNAWTYATSDISTNYKVSGSTFTSSVNNTLATAFGAGDDISGKIYVKTNNTDTDFSDFGFWILLNASTAEYQIPTITFDGAALTSNKPGMDANMQTAYSGYQYAYFVPSALTNKEKVIGYAISGLGTVNPSTDIGIALVAVGATKQTSGSNIVYSTVTDAAPAAQTYTMQYAVLDIS